MVPTEGIIMNRYKVTFNESIEYHVDSVNDHKAIDRALMMLRDNGYMFELKSIAIDCIADNS